MIRRFVGWFLAGYLGATFLNFATGWSDWRTILDLINGGLLGYYLTTGYTREVQILATDE